MRIRQLNNKIRVMDIIVIFILLFNPPIVKKSVLEYLISIIALLYVALHWSSARNLMKSHYFRKLLKLLLIFFMYYLLAAFGGYVSYSEKSIFYEYVKLLIKYVSVLCTSVYLVCTWKKKEYSIDSILALFVYTATIQSIFSFVTFIFPTVRLYFANMMINNARSEWMSQIAQSFVYWNQRLYGFSDNLYDMFGYTMSTIATISLFLAFKNGKVRYLMMAMMISVSAILNSRTSLILIGLGIAVLIIHDLWLRKISRKNAAMRFSLGAGIIVVLYFFVFIVSRTDTGFLIKSGIEEIVGVFKGRHEGYFYALFEQFIFFPKTVMGLLFGTGLAPDYFYRNSDVGYICNIFMYGLVGSMFLYHIYIFIFNYGKKNLRYKSLYVFFEIALFVYLIKSNIEGDIPVAYIFFPLGLFFSHCDDNELYKPIVF